MPSRMTAIVIGGLALLAVAVVGLAMAKNQNHAQWKQAATTLGITYDGADKVGKLHMSGTLDGMPVTMKLDGRGTAEFRRVWTQARVKAGLTEQVYLDSGVERMPIMRLENALAVQVTVGDPRFDEVFRVQGDEQQVMRLCDETSRRALLDATAFARVRIQEGDVIVEHLDMVKDPDKLVKTMQLAVELANTLKQTQIR